jgi:dihydrofolate reductase
MRKVVVFEFVSVDGVAESPERFFDAWDDEVDASNAAVTETQDAVILGHRSYDEWAAYWPTSDIEPFATFINGVSKHVAASTPLTGEWTKVAAIEGDLAEFVRDLRNQPGGDIGVHASLSVAQQLLAAGLVDELRLAVAPVVVGHGRRLLADLPPLRLQPIRSTTTPSGYVLTDYRVLVDADASALEA